LLDTPEGRHQIHKSVQVLLPVIKTNNVFSNFIYTLLLGFGKSSMLIKNSVFIPLLFPCRNFSFFFIKTDLKSPV